MFCVAADQDRDEAPEKGSQGEDALGVDTLGEDGPLKDASGEDATGDAEVDDTGKLRPAATVSPWAAAGSRSCARRTVEALGLRVRAAGTVAWDGPPPRV